VSRPPAEEFAFMLSTGQMLALKGFFPGRVEIIYGKVKEETPRPAFAEAGDVEVLTLLSRRPCTLADVADGLCIHVTEAIKLLDPLVKAGKLNRVGSGGRDFYIIQDRDEQQ
jgi:hypothetical protein